MTNDELLKRAAELETTAAAMRLVAEHGLEKCKIEVLQMGDSWAEASVPLFSRLDNYRASLKPQPKYEPFTRDDWRQFVLRPVTNNDAVFVVTGVTETYVLMSGTVRIPGFEEFLKDYTFADTGTPCGKLVSQ